MVREVEDERLEQLEEEARGESGSLGNASGGLQAARDKVDQGEGTLGGQGEREVRRSRSIGDKQDAHTSLKSKAKIDWHGVGTKRRPKSKTPRATALAGRRGSMGKGGDKVGLNGTAFGTAKVQQSVQ